MVGFGPEPKILNGPIIPCNPAEAQGRPRLNFPPTKG
ncbi:unnamed protein product [Arabidopsis halleri]